MVSVDALRATTAMVVGIVVAVLFSGYLPVPAAVGVGMIGYVALRRAMGAVYYGPLGLIGLFVVYGVAAGAEQFPPDATVAEGGLLIGTAVLLFFTYETLLRMGVAADAGGFDAAGINPFWKATGAVAALFVSIIQRVGVGGSEATVGATLSFAFVLTHASMRWSGVEPAVAFPVACLAVVLLAGTGLALTPRSHFDDSMQGSIVLALLSPFSRIRGFTRAVREENKQKPGTARSEPADPNPSEAAVGPIEELTTGIKRAGGRLRSALSRPTRALPDGGSIRRRGGFARIKHGIGSTATRITGAIAGGAARGSAGISAVSRQLSGFAGSLGRSESDGTETTTRAGGATQPGDSSGDETGCQNCGQERRDVQTRVLITNPPYSPAGNEIRLCESCQSARNQSSPIERCRTGVPVDKSRVIAAAGQQCQSCGRDAGQASGGLEAHAVVPMDGAGHPHEHNVVALCAACHEAAHGS